MLASLVFPSIDPVLVSIGPLAVRWYALAYIAGLIGGCWLMRRLAPRSGQGIAPEQIDDFLVWATIGVVLGGRLGYVLFYKPDYYLAHPLSILKVWEGGMSFHGGFLGVVLALFFFSRRRGISCLALGDLAAAAAPLGLFFGRAANFVNGELWGRPVNGDLPWAMIFPHVDVLPRHPSQLYEAALEGVVLFAVVLGVFALWPKARAHAGTLSGIFLAGYGSARFIAELFREPDPFLGFLIGGATMGQVLSLPMIALGIGLTVWALRRPPRVAVRASA